MEFCFSGNGEECIDLSASHLHVKVKIIKFEGTPVSVKELVAPVNLFLQALFSQVDISFNERIISSLTNNNCFRAHIKTLLNYGKVVKRSLLSREYFHKDENLTVADPLQTTN